MNLVIRNLTMEQVMRIKQQARMSGMSLERYLFYIATKTRVRK